MLRLLFLALLAGLLSLCAGAVAGISQVSLWSQVDTCAQSCATSASSHFASSLGCSGNGLYTCLCASLQAMGATAHDCASKSCTAFISYSADPERARAIVSEMCWANGLDGTGVAQVIATATASTSDTSQSTSAVSQQTATQAFPSSTIQSSSTTYAQFFYSSTTNQPSPTLKSSDQPSTSIASERGSPSLFSSNSSNSSNPTSSQSQPASHSKVFDVGIVTAVIAATGILTAIVIIWNKRKHDQQSTKLIDREKATPSPEKAHQGQTSLSNEARFVDASTKFIQWGTTPAGNTNVPNALLSTHFDSNTRFRASTSNTIRSDGSDIPENEPRDILLYSSNGTKVPAGAKLDTGAEENFISIATFLLLGYPMQKSKTPVVFTAANNEKFTVEHTAVVKFEGTSISSKRFELRFFVLDDLPVDVLLGNRFLQRNDIVRINRGVLPILRNRAQKEDPAKAKKRREEAEKRAKEQEEMKDVVWVRGPDGKYRRDDGADNGSEGQGKGAART